LNKKIKIDELFSLLSPLLRQYFSGMEFPWEVLPLLKEKMAESIENPPAGFKKLKDGILVGENVQIHPNAVIEGLAILGDNTRIRPGAYLRGTVYCGKDCVIGNSTELKNCILMDSVQVPHYNYVGDSILGDHAHMGAGAICSNLKNDGSNVVVRGEKAYETGLRKLGAILGDGANVGCGCVLNPGTVVGKNTSVYPLTLLRGVYPENSIVKNTNETVKRK